MPRQQGLQYFSLTGSLWTPSLELKEITGPLGSTCLSLVIWAKISPGQGEEKGAYLSPSHGWDPDSTWLGGSHSLKGFLMQGSQANCFGLILTFLNRGRDTMVPGSSPGL